MLALAAASASRFLLRVVFSASVKALVARSSVKSSLKAFSVEAKVSISAKNSEKSSPESMASTKEYELSSLVFLKISAIAALPLSIRLSKTLISDCFSAISLDRLAMAIFFALMLA